jgi:hypothetical protein
VELSGGCASDLSAPYFNLNGGCSMAVARAVVDFGVAGDPTAMPICARVSTSPGGALSWVDSGGIGHWTGGAFTPATASGRNTVTMTLRVRRPNGNNCNQLTTVLTERVAAPYVADDASGPVEYVHVLNTDDGSYGNSINQSPPGRNLRITVGLTPPLEVTDSWDDPPFYLRITTNSSQTQAVDCDDNTLIGPTGLRHSNFSNEIVDGCLTYYTPNVRNGDCSNYGTSSLPPPTTRSSPLDDCVITQTGVSAGQIRQALEDRFGGTPCKTLNNWPDGPNQPYPDPLTDGRYIVLFVVDESSFQDSGNAIYPIRTFGGFYLTGGDGLNCPGDDPPPPGGRQASAWGHFMTYVTPNPDSEPAEALCAFDEIGTCIAVLVE